MGIAVHPCEMPYLEAFVGDYVGDDVGKEYGVDDSVCKFHTIVFANGPVPMWEPLRKRSPLPASSVGHLGAVCAGVMPARSVYLTPEAFSTVLSVQAPWPRNNTSPWRC
jgi:hypothetical protein